MCILVIHLWIEGRTMGWLMDELHFGGSFDFAV